MKDLPQVEVSSCCLPLIRGRYQSLSPAGRKVAEFIISDPARVTSMTSVELAKMVGVSESTVVKCSQHLGFQGFYQLKMTLVRELATTPRSAFGEVEPEDTMADIKDKVFDAAVQALTDTAKVVDSDALQRAADLILGAERLFFFGVSSSGLVAADAQLKFMRIGITCGSYADSHVQATQAALLSSKDVAVVITYSGQTRDAIEVLRLAREGGAATICITNFPSSPAARASDIVLCTSSPEAGLRSGAMASRIAQLAVVDCLFTAVAIKHYDEAMASLIKTRAAVDSRKVQS